MSLEPGEGLLIGTVGPIHTWFMRFPIDVLFLARDLTVLGIHRNVRPWRVAWKPGARYVLELPAGVVERTGTRVGDRIVKSDRYLEA